MKVIKIENFTKKYGNFEAVKKLNLNIYKGQIVGFVGKNGAGKSTTLRCIVDMIHQTEGKIEIFGLDNIKDSKKIKERTSYIPSEMALYENITVDKLIRFTLKFTKSTEEEMQELLKYFELDSSKKVNELSLGNKKKVAIVQGLLRKPELIILDEPTSGLDPLIQKKFFELLLKEKEKGTTIFLSSHNLVEIEKYCDKVAIIKEGILEDYLDIKDIKINKKQTVTYKEIGKEIKTYLVEEDINELVLKLSKLKLEMLEIKANTVEDEFVEYYKEEE